MASCITVIRLLWPLLEFITKRTERLAPDEFAAALNSMVASPPLPDVELKCSHPRPAVSTLHEALDVKANGTVPPPSGIVSVILPSVSCGVTLSVFFARNGSYHSNSYPHNPIGRLNFYFHHFHVYFVLSKKGSLLKLI
jgi:hypothetical protein